MIQPTSQLDYVGISDIGLIRDHNEDVWAAYPERGFFILADGMGGHAAGEVAATESTSFLYDLVKKWHPTKQTSPDEVVAFFRDAVAKVNASIYNKGQLEASLSGMGTTICALYIHQMYAIVAHVGDSRIYRLREGMLEQLTEDHSLVSELVSLGAMKADECETFPFKHILTRAIGTHPSVEPSVNYLKIQPYDHYLLCSDGLTNYASDTEIESVLSSDTSPAERAQSLVDLANENGGGDNITLILVKINDDLSRQ